MFIDYWGISVDPETKQIRLYKNDYKITKGEEAGESLILTYDVAMAIAETNKILDKMVAIKDSGFYKDLTKALDRELTGIELWDMALAQSCREKGIEI